jgi:pilus assembly protein CpaE
MYPLRVIVIGCVENALLDLKAHLANEAIRVDAEFPTFAAALGELSFSDEQKRLLVVHVRDEADLKHVELLNNTRPGHPILGLTEGADDLALQLQVVRAGASQVVTFPLQPNDLERALYRIARQFGFAPAECKVVAVSGVTGGAGATTIAINLASEIAAKYRVPTILTEVGSHVGKLAVCLNAKPHTTMQQLLGNLKLDSALVRTSLTEIEDNFRILAGSYQSIQGKNATVADVVRLLELTRHLASMVLVDMPYSSDELYFGVLGMADHVVLIAEQRVPSIHALAVVRDALERRGISAQQSLVVNRYDASLPKLDARNLCKLLQVPVLETVRNDYLAVAGAQNNGWPLRREAPRSPVLTDLNRLAATLMGGAPNHRPAANKSTLRRAWQKLWS